MKNSLCVTHVTATNFKSICIDMKKHFSEKIATFLIRNNNIIHLTCCDWHCIGYLLPKELSSTGEASQ